MYKHADCSQRVTKKNSSVFFYMPTENDYLSRVVNFRGIDVLLLGI